MATDRLQELLADPDFQLANPDTQRYLLGQYDKNFAAQTRDGQDRFLQNYKKGITRQNTEAGKLGQAVQQRTMMKAEPIIRAETPQEVATRGPREAMASVATSPFSSGEAGTPPMDPMDFVPSPAGVGRRVAGAAVGGLATEGAGAVGRLLARRGPGGVQRIGERATDRVTGAVEGMVPGAKALTEGLQPGGMGTRLANTMGFGLPRKGLGLQSAVTHEGGKLADATWREAGQVADAAISARGGQLGSRELFQIWEAVRHGFMSSPVSKTNEGRQWFADQYGRGGSMTVEQARNLISEYRMLMSNVGEGASSTGANQLAAQARDRMYQQIEQLAGPDISAAVRSSDAQKAAAVALFGTRKEAGILADVWTPKGTLDVGKLSARLAKDRGEIIARIGEDGYMALMKAVQPGAAVGQRSIVREGSNEGTSGIRQLLGARGGMGTVFGTLSGAGAAVPGAVNRYQGKQIRRGMGQNVATGVGATLGGVLAGGKDEDSMGESPRRGRGNR